MPPVQKGQPKNSGLLLPLNKSSENFPKMAVFFSILGRQQTAFFPFLVYTHALYRLSMAPGFSPSLSSSSYIFLPFSYPTHTVFLSLFSRTVLSFTFSCTRSVIVCPWEKNYLFLQKPSSISCLWVKKLSFGTFIK